jgi:hypothetical protein
MKTHTIGAILAVLLAGLGPLPALAHDLMAPTWRGQEGTTHQEWRFDTPANPAVPEVISNQYGSAVAAISVGGMGSGWLDQLPAMGTQTGYWDISGQGGAIVIDIDNRPVPLAYKEIWIQVTYYKDLTQAPLVDVPGAARLGGQSLLVENAPPIGAWMLDQSIWRLEPNPPHEQIVILPHGDGSVIDQIVVDTICAPEPASLAGLVLAGTAVFGPRRRRV